MNGYPKKVVRDAIAKLLTLGVNYRLHRYLIDRSQDDWRSLVSDLHVRYDVKGIGIIASRTNITSGYFLHKDELILPDDIIYMLGEQLFDASMASYAFTILEIAGDELVREINHSHEEGKAWHLGVKQNHELSEGEAQGLKIRFAKIFGVDRNIVPTEVIIRLARVKAKRNEFAHQGKQRVDFPNFLEDTLAILCHLFFMCNDDEQTLSVFPFSAYNSKWDVGNLEGLEEPVTFGNR
ncbi:hypothetical protein [Rhizobium ruizarguesonis]|uniref:hypothetical protein n=1 Tax=Rhizobium ruizarguesonis TaxID=2081791 RepID=UPI00102F72AC|nr:hypothetical protein [Rhizobium ruizarguesonis]TBA91092.1 hypothetical protein ELH54_15280 [Rhizobium ruizarguesonis]